MLNGAQVEFLRGLIQAWGQNPAQAILLARLNAGTLTPAMVQAVLQEAANTAQHAQSGGSSQMIAATLGLYAEPDARMLAQAQEYQWIAQILSGIIASGGDPAAPAELRRMAFDVLSGRGNPHEAAVLGADVVCLGHHGLTAVLRMAENIGADPNAVLGRVGVAAAAMALPRAKLMEIAGGTPGTGTSGKSAAGEGDVRAKIASLMERATQQAASDAKAAEAMMVKVIELTQNTPEADDDLRAIRTLLLISGNNAISAPTVKLCVERLAALVEAGLSGDEAAQTVWSFDTYVVSTEQSDTLTGKLTASAAALLGKPLGDEMRFTLGQMAAGAHARLGEHDKAARVLRGLKKMKLDAGQRLQVAQREADGYWAGDDHATAADVLCEAIDGAAGASAELRMAALQKVLSVAPASYPGLEKRVAEFAACIDACEEPMRTMHRVTLVLLLQKRGEKESALRTAALVDFKALRRVVPANFAGMFDEMERGFESTMTQLRK